jgi:hypothetical protein
MKSIFAARAAIAGQLGDSVSQSDCLFDIELLNCIGVNQQHQKTYGKAFLAAGGLIAACGGERERRFDCSSGIELLNCIGKDQQHQKTNGKASGKSVESGTRTHNQAL